MKFCLGFLFFVLSITPTFAQDRQGNDTAGSWVATHFSRFGQWDSICDARGSGDTDEQRCYIRYVDVFSPHPDFGAVFLFLTPSVDGLEIEIGIERGTIYDADGFHMKVANDVIWVLPDACLASEKCVLSQSGAAEFVEAAVLGGQSGGLLVQQFTDRHDNVQTLNWELSQFPMAFQDFETEVRDRQLWSE